MFFRAMAIAFGMYSKIPMPRVDWDENSMKYALCFFPMVGMAVGGAVYLVGAMLFSLKTGNLLLGCIMTVVPLLVTGGIHFDGFLDTMDGINSYADKAKRLEILKDSNSGAFAILGGLIYFTLSVGFWSEANKNCLEFVALGFVMSRALSGFSVVAFPKAKNTGLAAAFNNSAHKGTVKIVMAVYFLLSAFTMLYINTVYGIIATTAALLCFLYHYYNCRVNFGGITGDLAGYFLQLCELAILMATVLLRVVLN